MKYETVEAFKIKSEQWGWNKNGQWERNSKLLKNFWYSENGTEKEKWDRHSKFSVYFWNSENGTKVGTVEIGLFCSAKN